MQSISYNMSNHDQLYRQSKSHIDDFVFDKKVVDVFNDMIHRSVPSYQQILKMLPTISRQHRIPKANYYDLGCSLGAGMLAIAQGLDNLDTNIIGIDSSQSMIDKAKQTLQQHSPHANINYSLHCENITHSQIENAAIVLLNFTLQFLPIKSRNPLLENIYQNLNNEGILVLSEKIKFDNKTTQNLFQRIHHQYKTDQGYTDTEIQQKRQAIENVLLPETLETHINRLKKVGFTQVSVWLQNLQFISIIAKK